jgi:hypothetical protein
MAMTASAWPVSSTDDDVPFARRSGGGARFQGWLLTLCVLAGGAVVAYRNDYLFQLAKSFRQESAYLALERQYLGGAPDGTPRDVKKLMDGVAPAIQTVVFGRDNSRHDHESLGGSVGLGASSIGASSIGASAGSGEQAGAAVAPASVPASESATKPQTVSVEPPKTESPNVATRATTTSATESKTTGYRASSPAPRVTEPKRESGSRSFANASDDDKPARASRERVAKSEPEARPEPMPAAGTDDFLHMSMRQAIKKKSGSGASASSSSSEPPKKKKSSRGDYDPLNGEI